MEWHMARAGTLALLLALISSVYCQDPIVKIKESEPAITKGVIQQVWNKDITMSCSVENQMEGTLLRWKKVYFDEANNRLQVSQVSVDMSVDDNIKYSIEKPTQFTWRLRIKSVQVYDEGNYTCWVYTTRDTVKEANVTVQIGIQPYFVQALTSSSMTVKEGDTVDLLCYAEGRPTPTIQWTRLGGALLPIGKEVHFESKMTIVNIQPDARGRYICRAYNYIQYQVQEVIRVIELGVTFQPIVKPNIETLYQKVGYQIELQCLIEANPFPYPVSEGGLMWIRGSTVISQSLGNYRVKSLQGAFNQLLYELIILKVQDNDFGTYRCQVKNAEGTTSAIVELRESDTPQNSVKLGQVIEGGSGATAVHVYLATLITCLMALAMHYA